MRFDLRADLPRACSAAHAAIDQAAEAARQRFLTPGAGQGAVYQLKLAEAQAFVSRYPCAEAAAAARDADWPFLAAEVGITAPDLAAVAAAVIAAAARWHAVAAEIEHLRLKAKRAVKDAGNAAAIAAAAAVEWP